MRKTKKERAKAKAKEEETSLLLDEVLQLNKEVVNDRVPKSTKEEGEPSATILQFPSEQKTAESGDD